MASKTRSSKDVDSDVVSCKDLETVVAERDKETLQSVQSGNEKTAHRSSRKFGKPHEGPGNWGARLRERI